MQINRLTSERKILDDTLLGKTFALIAYTLWRYVLLI